MTINFALLSTFFDEGISRFIFFADDIATFTFLILFSILLMLEVNFSNRQWPVDKWQQSFLTNSSLFLFNSVTLSLLSIASLVVFAENYSDQGLLSNLSNPLLKLAIALITVDLITYFWHRACHYFDCLWMFHKIHHSDPSVNVTTAFRIHIAECVLTSCVKAISIILLGLDKMTLLGIETITALFVMFHHANIAFPGEKWLSHFFITPYLHRVHHSTVRKEHDKNMGTILTLWDHLLGTFKALEPKTIGIVNNAPLDFFSQLKFGFINGVYQPIQPSGTLLPATQIRHMIAEAAYYKSEKRNFTGNHILNDWLEAESEIMYQVQVGKAQPASKAYEPSLAMG